MSILKKKSQKLYWRKIWSDPNISEEFIERYIEKANWDLLSKNTNLRKAFFEKHKELIKLKLKK